MDFNTYLKLKEENARGLGLIGPDYDYGLLRGMIDKRGHGIDLGKLPNHITFSNESYYSSKKLPGGEWSKDFQGNIFTSSKRMIGLHGMNNYKKYFNRVEPDVRLNLIEK